MTGGEPPAPDVGVVIPVFNNALHISAAIDSVLAQTLPVVEIIVVDDGSTDESAALAACYGEPVTVVLRSHAGQGATRNAGVALVSGELLAFLDADDVWLPEKTALQVAALAENETCAMAFGRVEQFFSPELGREGESPRAIDASEQQGRLPSALLVRTEAFRQVGGFREDVTFGEFLDWYLRAEEAGLTACTVEEVVVRRRIHTSNAGVRDHAKRSEYATVLKGMLDRRAAASEAD